VLNLWTHGLISPMLFLIVACSTTAPTTATSRASGTAAQVPEYAGLLGLAFFASLGLPGLCGFVSEFTVFLGSLPPGDDDDHLRPERDHQRGVTISGPSSG